MNESLLSRLEHLETLYTQQEYTVQALNDMVARQDREITSLALGLERLKEQLKALKADAASDISSEIEKPPHY